MAVSSNWILYVDFLIFITAPDHEYEPLFVNTPHLREVLANPNPKILEYEP